MELELTEVSNQLRSTIIMCLCRKPEGTDWDIIKRLCRTLDLEIGGTKLTRIAKLRNNIAVYQLVDLLGLDDEEKLLIFDPLFQNEVFGSGTGGAQNDEVYAIKEN